MFSRRYDALPLSRFHYFRQGTCIVHHIFGADVVRSVREHYADAFHTAHLEVPGEMFALAVEAEKQGRGVVGSTSNILGFISDRVDEAVVRAEPAHLQVVLGTEAGMITSIVNRVQQRLQEHGRDDVEVEVIFPVSSEAVAVAPESDLQLLPGVQGGEGCSTAGGCATCPFMKMNNVDSLFDVLERIGNSDLNAWAPRKYLEMVQGRTIADLGSEPILHMRDFQRTGELPQALVDQILS
jgi:quinolinate synthase